MSLLHNKSSGYHNLIWKKKYGFHLNTKLLSSLPLRPGRNYAVLLCSYFIGDLLVLFRTMCAFVKGPCDIKSLKISPAYDVWFSRYWPSNLMLATNSALVIVFISFLWAVYRWWKIANTIRVITKAKGSTIDINANTLNLIILHLSTFAKLIILQRQHNRGVWDDWYQKLIYCMRFRDYNEFWEGYQNVRGRARLKKSNTEVDRMRDLTYCSYKPENIVTSPNRSVLITIITFSISPLKC